MLRLRDFFYFSFRTRCVNQNANQRHNFADVSSSTIRECLPGAHSLDRQSNRATTNKSLISRQEEEEEGANPIRTIRDPLCVSADYGLLTKKV